MNSAEATIRFKVFSIMVSLLLIVGGIYCYNNLGRLEDPDFSIKDVQVITFYPGATPKEVEKEVSEPLESALQEMGQVKKIKSLSQAGRSTITVTIKDNYTSQQLPQVWDELRRKINDSQSKLPPGAQPSIVFDDFGDVFGILLALHGDGFSARELLDQAEFLQRELLQIKDVAKIIIWGSQQEQIFVEISRPRMQQLGISLEKIYLALHKKNIVAPAGHVKIDQEYIRIQPSGSYSSLEDIGNTSITSFGSKLIYLKDIATITRGYISPPSKHMRIDGKEGIVLGISTASGGNIVTMGKAIADKIEALKPQIPLGLGIKYIYYQGEIVEKSVNAFVINFMEALAIVIVVLMIFMGLRSGLLIGSILVLTVCATIIVMYISGLSLQRISLGALIIALGMLVDNAIVVIEGMLIKIQQGQKHLQAVIEVVSQTQWPLLEATVIAVLAFAAIGLSPDSTGEFLKSLFQVMLISLGLIWLIAITLAPLFAYLFLKSGKLISGSDPYKGLLFQFYRGTLRACIKLKWLTVIFVVALLVIAAYFFTLLPQSFSPDSISDKFMVNYWLPEGTDIRKTSNDVKELEKYISKLPDVTSVASFIGGGAPRFMLVYSPEKNYSSYAFLLVTVDDYTAIPQLKNKIESYIANQLIDANPKIEMIPLGPGGGYPWELRL